MTRFRIGRTRSDWLRFTAIMLAALVSLANATRLASQQSWLSMALTLAAGLCFAAVAFASISTNPRVRRITSWPRRLDAAAGRQHPQTSEFRPIRRGRNGIG